MTLFTKKRKKFNSYRTMACSTPSTAERCSCRPASASHSTQQWRCNFQIIFMRITPLASRQCTTCSRVLPRPSSFEPPVSLQASSKEFRSVAPVQQQQSGRHNNTAAAESGKRTHPGASSRRQCRFHVSTHRSERLAPRTSDAAHKDSSERVRKVQDGK